MSKAIYSALMFLFGGFFQGIASFFLKFLTKRFALGAAAAVSFLAFTAAFIVALNAIITSIAVSMPGSMAIAVSWFVPNNASACISAYFAALLARWVYDQKTKIIQYTLF